MMSLKVWETEKTYLKMLLLEAAKLTGKTNKYELYELAE